MMDILYLIPFLVLMFPAERKLMIPWLIIAAAALIIYYRFEQFCQKQNMDAELKNKGRRKIPVSESAADRPDSDLNHSSEIRLESDDKRNAKPSQISERAPGAHLPSDLSIKPAMRGFIILISVLMDAAACFGFYSRWMNFMNVRGELPEGSMIPWLLIVLSILIGILAGYGIYRLVLLFFKKEREFVSWIGCGPLSFILTISTWLLYGSALLYTRIDNWILSIVLNGIYDPADRTSMFVSPIISWICTFLSRFLPDADTFTLILELTLFFAIWFLLYCALKNRVSLKAVLGFLLFMWIVGSSTKIFFQNFTLTAGFAVAAGLYGMISAVRGRRIWMIIPAGILIFFGFAIRLESALVMIPFGGLAFLMDFFEGGFSFKKPYRTVMISGLVMTLICTAVSAYSYFHHNYSPEMNTARIYNDTRSNLWDFPRKPLVFADPSGTDLSVNDLKTALNMIVADTDFYTAERLEQVYEIVKEDQQPLTEKKINGILDLIGKMISERPYMQLEIAVWLIISLYVLINYKRGWIRFLGLLLCAAGTLIIFMYFGLIGRIPARLMQMTFYGGWICILTALSGSEKQRKPVFGFTLLPLLVLLSVWWEGSYSQLKVQDHPNLFAVLSARNSNPEAEIHDQKKRVWYVYDFDDYAIDELSSDDKLPSEEFFTYNVPAGEWTYGQPYFKTYLERIGMPNPMASLASGEANFVGEEKKAEVIEQYLKEHYDPGFEKVSVEEIAGRPQWKFEAVQKQDTDPYPDQAESAEAESDGLTQEQAAEQSASEWIESEQSVVPNESFQDLPVQDQNSETGFEEAAGPVEVS